MFLFKKVVILPSALLSEIKNWDTWALKKFLQTMTDGSNRKSRLIDSKVGQQTFLHGFSGIKIIPLWFVIAEGPSNTVIIYRIFCYHKHTLKLTIAFIILKVCINRGWIISTYFSISNTSEAWLLILSVRHCG